MLLQARTFRPVSGCIATHICESRRCATSCFLSPHSTRSTGTITCRRQQYPCDNVDSSSSCGVCPYANPRSGLWTRCRCAHAGCAAALSVGAWQTPSVPEDTRLPQSPPYVALFYSVSSICLPHVVGRVLSLRDDCIRIRNASPPLKMPSRPSSGTSLGISREIVSMLLFGKHALPHSTASFALSRAWFACLSTR